MQQGELSFFDPIEGEARATAAIEQVALAAVEGWVQAALDALYRCARALADFTTDDVWYELRDCSATHEPRAMGAVTREALKPGWISKTEGFRKSKRPECHRRPLQVWKSNICEVKQK